MVKTKQTLATRSDQPISVVTAYKTQAIGAPALTAHKGIGSNKWTVTHSVTGKAIARDFPTLRHALAFIENVAQFDWTLQTAQALVSTYPLIHEFVRTRARANGGR